MAYAKVNSITNADMAKVFNIEKASFGKIAGIDAPAGAAVTEISNTYSLNFDGVDDIFYSGTLTPNLGTWSLWFKSPPKSGWGVILSFDTNVAYFGYDGSGDLFVIWTGARPGSGSYHYFNANYDDDAWHQVVFQFSGGAATSWNNRIRGYIDGSLEIDETETRDYSSYGIVPTEICLGAYSVATDNLHFEGSIDELGFWDDHILTADEITTIYNSGTPIDLQQDGGNYSSSANLTTYYRMGDGDTYPTIEDNEGSNDATMTNMTSGDLVEDVPVAFDAYSILLDGVDDYMTADGAAEVISGDLGSVSLWAKLGTYSYTETIFNSRIDGDNYLWCFYHGGTNQTRFEMKGNGTEETLMTTTAVENNGWHHFAFTWDSSGNTSAFYVDGSSVDTGTAPAFNGTIDEIEFGKRRYTAWGEFAGNMNDIALFNDVLTSVEVTAIYNSGVPKDESSHSGLVGYWKMEENTGTTVADSSSNSNVITLINGAAFAADTP